MTALVQSANATNGGGTSFTASISSTSGHALVCYITGWSSGSTANNISSVTDSTGTNAWLYSTATSSQNPPSSGSYDSVHAEYGFTAIAVCLNAAAVTSVTAVFARSVYGEVGVSEFSGLPAGSQVLTAASSGTLASGATSYSPPALTTSSVALAVACTSGFGDFSGVTPSGWNELSYTDTLAAYDLAAAAGTVQPVFTGPSQDVPSSAIIAIGVPPPSRGLLMAAII
jgi:hypothetical protein